jgi:hypothetical protein
VLTELVERRDERERWRLRAACRGLGHDRFVPPRSKQTKGSEAPPECAGCPVRAECRTVAATEGLEGWWGGILFRRGRPIDEHTSSQRDRRAVRRRGD